MVCYINHTVRYQNIFFVCRLESIFAVAEDTEIDIPQLWKYLGELMGPTAFDGNLGLDELFKCVFKYVSKHKAARLFACILQSSEKVIRIVSVTPVLFIVDKCGDTSPTVQMLDLQLILSSKLKPKRNSSCFHYLPNMGLDEA